MTESTLIKSADGSNVFVDSWDDNGVWLSIQHRFGTAHTTFTTEQVKEMIAALQAAIGEQA